jgi:hypothetical protein
MVLGTEGQKVGLEGPEGWSGVARIVGSLYWSMQFSGPEAGLRGGNRGSLVGKGSLTWAPAGLIFACAQFGLWAG